MGFRTCWASFADEHRVITSWHSLALCYGMKTSYEVSYSLAAVFLLETYCAKMSLPDGEGARVVYEEAVQRNPGSIEAVNFLAFWHLERQSYVQAKKYFAHLATLVHEDVDVWIALCVACAMTEELDEASKAAVHAKFLSHRDSDISLQVRLGFCDGLVLEKQQQYAAAIEEYSICLRKCNEYLETPNPIADYSAQHGLSSPANSVAAHLKELKGDLLLRLAHVHRDNNDLATTAELLSQIIEGSYPEVVQANALCLKGTILEMSNDFSNAELVYRSALQLVHNHLLALERLGRVYLRYQETIPAAVQCFFMSVEINPNNHTTWYLLGRCYMATSQYNDAFEAYQRAVTLQPSDSQVWCSLGVLYYAYGQYLEALGMFSRAIKLNPAMADAWYNVGALYDLCDQPEDAQAAYLQAQQHGLLDRFTAASPSEDTEGSGAVRKGASGSASVESNILASSSLEDMAASSAGSVAGGSILPQSSQATTSETVGTSL